MTQVVAALRIFLLSLFVLLGAGCQRTEEAPKAAIKDVSLFHYWSFSGTFVGTLDAIAADINRQNPDYVFKHTPLDHESFKISIRNDLRLGNTADIYTYWAGARTQSIIDQLAPLDDVLPSDEMNKLFGTSVVRSACSYNGQIYLLPVSQHFVGFYYNKKVFADNGLLPPTNWKSF